MHRPHIEMGIVLVDHVRFVTLTEFLLPFFPVSCLPLSPRLPRLPVRTNERVPRTVLVITPELVLEFEGYFM
jgi:hypothetical protein